jgi:hypothetical protein
VILSVDQLLYDRCEGLNDDQTEPTHVRECYEILAGPMVDFPIQVRWNNDRTAKAKELVAKAEGRNAKPSRRIVKAKERIDKANERIAEAKAYLFAAIERCKSMYGEADTVVAFEALAVRLDEAPLPSGERGPARIFAIQLGVGKL